VKSNVGSQVVVNMLVKEERSFPPGKVCGRRSKGYFSWSGR